MGNQRPIKIGVIAGRNHDTPLTDLGRQQAMEIAQKAYVLNFYNIYHSPMIRAHDTAKIINQTKQAPLNLIANLKEWDVGDWSGLSQVEITDLLNKGLHPKNGMRTVVV